MRFRFALPLLAAASLTACLDVDDGCITSIETTTFHPALNVDLAASAILPGGTYYRDLTPGSGAVVASGQVLSVRYVGWLANGVKFDETAPGAPNFTFTLGAGRVVPGWDAGLPGMRVGGLRQLIIPASQGYGRNPVGPIPGCSILVFNVNVVAATTPP